MEILKRSNNHVIILKDRTEEKWGFILKDGVEQIGDR